MDTKIKRIILAVIIPIFIMSLKSISLAEEITLTTILPSQDELRVRGGFVGDGPDLNPPDGTPDWNYSNESVIDNSLIVGDRIGLGTLNLGAKLSIGSANTATSVISIFNSNQNQIFELREGAAGNPILNMRNDDGTQWLHLQRGSNSQISLGTWNLGIGTTTPESKLVVLGDTNDSTDSVFDLRDSDNNSLFFVRNDGNIGIGTTAPNAPGFLGSQVIINGHMHSRGCIPLSNNLFDLGTSAIRWRTVYATGSTLPFTGAHEFPIRGDADFKMGDAIIMENGEIKKSYKPRDPRVLGLYVETMNGKCIVAAVGDNKINDTNHGFNICDEGGRVQEGDLLTTSSTPGYLMRQVDENGKYDNVIRDYTVGKAMENVKFDRDGKAEEIYGFIYSG